MERVKTLESSTEESLGIGEAVCMKSVVRNWRDPTCHQKVKVKCISLAKSRSWQEGVGGERSTYDDRVRKCGLWKGSLLHSCL